MNKKRIRLLVVPTIYLLAISAFGIGLYLLERNVNNQRFKNEEQMEYVDREIVTDNEYIPVVNIQETIVKPFLIDNISINKTFYNIDDEETNQENSIIIYEDTYMQNTGVDYKYNESFDIISILDGTIIEVTDNDILGKTIKIRHNNNLISTYQSLSEVNVNKDDSVLKGQVIGKSGNCKLYDTDYNLHFELSYQGKNIDPEKSYNKTIDEL